MNDEIYVVMNHVTGRGEDSQWFDYRLGFYAPVTRIEWELGTMHIVLPRTEAEKLIRNGHARLMTSKEREEYPLTSKAESSANEGGSL